jgi:ABC-2 type transport system permease protein/oleandomycin transport system permease protein
VTALATTKPTPLETLGWTISDILTIAHRDILRLVRIPTSLVFAILQPVMFVLLFRYVFGGSIKLSPQFGGYVNYLVPGILVQTTLFGSINTAIGLSEDMQQGFIERFRSLPMSRTAVLGGRTVSDLARNFFILIIISAIGFAVGFRPGGGVLPYFEAGLLMLLFAFCLSWGSAFIGLKAPNSETAQAMMFPIIFPLSFASSILVQVQRMPGWLQGFAKYQPVSDAATAVRGLMLGTPTGASVWETIAWSFGILLVLGTLSVRTYRNVA